MRKTVFTLVLVLGGLVSFKSHGQIGVSYLHSEVLSTFGISTNLEKRVWGEFRIGMGVNDFSPQFHFNYNFIRKDKIDLFASVGYSDRLDAHTFLSSIGFNVNPFKEVEDLYLTAEGGVAFGDIDYTQGSIGIRYFFKKKDKGK